MAFVQTEGSLESLGKRTDPIPPYGLMLTSDLFATYGAIWKAQPAVRTVVGFMARNIAQLGLHVFDRVDDTDRVRLKDHPMARLIERPLPPEYKITRYKLFSDLMHDIGIYDQSLWIKVKTDGNQPNGLVRVPPYRVYPLGGSWLKPDYFEIRGNSSKVQLAPEEVVFIRGYSPDDSREGVPPIESLRQILAEDLESARYREQMWQSGSRMSGYIQRPVEAPRWNPGARQRFRDEWDAQYQGWADDARTPILEDGMTWVAAGVTPEQAQYVESRKLTREEVASAYYIPPSMVGAADATFASIREQHQMLYQDALGPWLEMIQEEIELQLLPDFEPYPTTVYVEFNINDKMKGSFEDQASSMSTLVGRPVMTANEGRARLNLPQLPEGEGLVTPLNVMIGGQPNPQNPLEEPNATEPNPAAPAPDATELDGETQAASMGIRVKAQVSQPATDKLEDVFSKFFARQEAAVVAKIGGKANWWSQDRWDKELSADLFNPFLAMATEAGRKTMEDIGEPPDDYDEDRTLNWMLAHASGVASGINATTFEKIKEALGRDNPLAAVKSLFKWFKESRAKQLAQTSSTGLSGFGTHEAIQQKQKEGTKTWITGFNPRGRHKELNGETVDLYKTFSNGARWPGDGHLPVDQRANCNCDMEVKIKKG